MRRHAGAGDTLVVWRLDRLGRSIPHLVGLVEELLGKGIGFRSLQDGVIDTTTASGELIFNIFSSLAQFERPLIQERTTAGLAAARARGRLGGRKPISPDDPAGGDRQAPAQGSESEHRSDLQDVGNFQTNLLPVRGATRCRCEKTRVNALAQLVVPMIVTARDQPGGLGGASHVEGVPPSLDGHRDLSSGRQAAIGARRLPGAQRQGADAHVYLVSAAYSLLMHAMHASSSHEWTRRTLTTIGEACRAVKSLPRT